MYCIRPDPLRASKRVWLRETSQAGGCQGTRVIPNFVFGCQGEAGRQCRPSHLSRFLRMGLSFHIDCVGSSFV